MKIKSIYIIVISVLISLLVFYDFNQAQYAKKAVLIITRLVDPPNKWNRGFKEVKIKSRFTKHEQYAYFHKTQDKEARPLVVSLHTWGGDHTQPDPLSQLCLENNLNYIHPNFNGPNNNPNSCCSNLVIGQIDEAIDFAIQNSNVDIKNIHVIGLSGGGYTAMCHYLLSEFQVASYQSWVGISDLESWYYQSISKENLSWKDILACTESKDSLNIYEARRRSPLHMPISKKKSMATELNLYTGIHDGVQGSVPITHSINFYNKIVSELYKDEPFRMVTLKETLYLLENRRALGKYGSINNRAVFFAKKNPNVNLFIFEGEHEILPEHAILSIL
ncbi:alpha/beta hydrolase family protein [Flagellimonas profundi]|uniref:Peptidase S9 prolyl oligopeptidase catalytic domain-containing protein n=1 Tax=Flagellimonas profundi TaxID=2915620 RepID=A0ABS3FBK6_9FLAO|nr:hypothetical protein [Allomuricauda profundi]MBO0340536.1 hypothetical protein [Allomuricauda profundi]